MEKQMRKSVRFSGPRANYWKVKEEWKKGFMSAFLLVALGLLSNGCPFLLGGEEEKIGALFGKVTDANTNSAMNKIQVTVSGKSDITNAIGEFQIEGLEVRSHKITAKDISSVKANSTVISSPTSVAADNTSTSTVTVTLKGTNDDSVSGHEIVISSGSHPTTIIPSSGTTDSSGQVMFTVKSTQEGVATITVTKVGYEEYVSVAEIKEGENQHNISMTTDTTLDTTKASTTSITFTDSTPPLKIQSLSHSNITSSSATITWVTNGLANSQVDYRRGNFSYGYGFISIYGYTSTPLDTNLVTDHNVKIIDLLQNTYYEYKGKSKEIGGNPITSEPKVFKTSTSTILPPEPLKIQLLLHSNITSSSATITWVTNRLADSQVDYRRGNFSYGYGFSSVYGYTSISLDTNLVINHAVELPNLIQDTYYEYKAKSKESGGSLLISDPMVFKTSIDTTPPLTIQSLSHSNITSSSATITWVTNRLADSQVDYRRGNFSYGYGFTSVYGYTSSSLNTNLVTNHSVGLPNLMQNTYYEYKAKSKDAGGSLVISDPNVFKTSNYGF